MKNLFLKFNSIHKIAITVFFITMVSIIAFTATACSSTTKADSNTQAQVDSWGPSRPTYTYEKPADHVVFNSITDNPDVGDERNFVRIKEDSTTSTYVDSVTLEPGKDYQVMVYYHNNAASNLNSSDVGIAKNTTLKMEIPAVVKAGANAALTGTINASNANPASVFNITYGTNATEGDIALRYVSESATVTSNGAINGAKLPDSLFTTGTNLGYDSLDGVIPGGNDFSGYVTFKFRADQPNFTILNEVHTTGVDGWKKSESLKVGDSVDFLITYKNTGTTIQNDVVIEDLLPSGVTYTSGTTFLANTTNPDGLLVGDNIASGGINIGAYSPGAVAYIKFSATITGGEGSEQNEAKAETNNGTKTDSSEIVISK